MESGGNLDWKRGLIVLAAAKFISPHSFLDVSLARFSPSTIAVDLS